MADLYKIKKHSGGRFTAYERDNGRWEIDRPGNNETFNLSRNASIFTIIENERGVTTKDIYVDRNKDHIFEFQQTKLLSRKPGSLEETYKVDRLTGGNLNVFEWDDRRWQPELPDRNERFTLSRSGNTFTRIEFKNKGTEINVYKDGDRDGIFEFTSTRFEPSDMRFDQRRLAFEGAGENLTSNLPSL